jgi:ferredoxin
MSVRLEVAGYGIYELAPGGSLLEACEAVGVPMLAECGGFAACCSCRVAVLGGAGLSPIVDEEEPFLDRDDQRLACQARLIGDVSVRLDPGM